MNAYTTRDWRADANAVDIREVAAALGIEHKRGDYIFPHPGCNGVHSSGGYSVYYGTETGKLHCRRCDGPASYFDVPDLIAITMRLEPRRLRSTDWARVQEVAASFGWCLPDPRAGRGPDPEVWQAERAAALAEQAERARIAEEERRRGAIDVHRAWNALNAGRIGRDQVTRWARDARGCPEDLLEHLPFDSLAYVPRDCPARPETVSANDWPEAWRLMRAAHCIDRRVLIALRDVEGRPVGASRRWHKAGKPTDDMDKALAVGPNLCLEGRPINWRGGCAIFGDFLMAVAKALRGEPLFILEGGPDWLIAEAALRRAQYGAALAVPGCWTMPKLANLLRDALWQAMPARRPQVVIVPDRGKAADTNAYKSADALRAAADVTIRRTGSDDFNDMVRERRRTADAVTEFLLKGGS